MTHSEVYRKHSWMFAQSWAFEPMHPIEYEDGLEVGPGWLPLLDCALTEIGEEVERMPKRRKPFEIIRISEELGKLRIQTRGGNKRIVEILRTAEEISRKTCEECGGTMHAFGDNPHAMRCEPCGRECVRASLEVGTRTTR